MSDLNPETGATDATEDSHEGSHEENLHEEKSDSESQDPMVSEEMLHVDRFEGAWMRISAVVISIFFVAVIVSSLCSRVPTARRIRTHRSRDSI